MRIFSSLIVVFLTTFIVKVNAEEVSRSQFVGDIAAGMSAQLCTNDNSPFKQVYEGEPEKCQPTVSKFIGICSKKVVPDTIDPRVDGMEKMVMLSQCIVANYQGGDILKEYNDTFTGKLILKRDLWLRNLQPVMARNMCEQKQSDFGRAYQGENCHEDVNTLFVKCTTEVENVAIPEILESLQEADHHGQVIAACITAHYVGGESLRSFSSMQAE